MTEPLTHIEKFFEKDSFSAKELNKLLKRVKAVSKKEDVKFLHSKIQEELQAFKKNGKSYKRPKYRVLKTKSRHLNYDLVNKFLFENSEANNLELAQKLKLSFVQMTGIAEKHNISEFKEDGFLTEKEKALLFDFFESRLYALNRQKTTIKRKEETTSDRSKKKPKAKSKRKKSFGSAGVYDKIKEHGGIGKLIYNAMRK